jgi:Peptidase family M50
VDFLLALLGCWAATGATPTLLVLPHELGHAFVALAFGGRSDVAVGREPRPLGFRLGRLSVRIRPLNGWRWMWYGTAPSELPNATTPQVALVAAAGPLVTLLLAGAYVFAAVATGGFLRGLFAFLAAGGAWTFVVTALPMRYGRNFGPYAGRESDGYRVRRALAH